MCTDVENSCIIHFWVDNHSTPDCQTYTNLSIEDKLNILKQKSACFACHPAHMLEKCTVKSFCGDNCDKFHLLNLHTDVTSGLSNTKTDTFVTKNTCYESHTGL